MRLKMCCALCIVQFLNRFAYYLDKIHTLYYMFELLREVVSKTIVFWEMSKISKITFIDKKLPII